MIHAHGDDVVVGIPFQIRRQVILKTGKTERPSADELAVDPDFGMVINAVELNRDEFIFLRRVEPEMFAIPADAAGRVATAAAIFRAERPFAAPIVRTFNCRQLLSSNAGIIAAAKSPLEKS